MGAEALGFDAGIGHKRGTAVATPQGMVHGFLLTEATNLPKGPQRGGRIRTISEVEGEEKAGYNNEARGKKNQVVHFLSTAPGSLFQR